MSNRCIHICTGAAIVAALEICPFTATFLSPLPGNAKYAELASYLPIKLNKVFRHELMDYFYTNLLLNIFKSMYFYQLGKKPEQLGNNVRGSNSL